MSPFDREWNRTGRQIRVIQGFAFMWIGTVAIGLIVGLVWLVMTFSHYGVNGLATKAGEATAAFKKAADQ